MTGVRLAWLVTGFLGPMVLSLWLLSGAAQSQGSEQDEGRALPYEGFPPLVPHDIDGDSKACLACHGVDGPDAISPHPTRAHFCVECHVRENPGVAPLSTQAGPLEAARRQPRRPHPSSLPPLPGRRALIALDHHRLAERDAR